MGYNSLSNYYQTMFALRQHHKYDDAYMESWIPYERDIYVEMLLAHLEEEKLKMRQQYGNR
ncbi:baseplate hub assembly catalyst protein [Stenotrophomonas phage vB_SmaS-DLP_6]|nr:baseplate hub assembly catalyst protein [Stenotrophomonas phage vB_SmaS-DLP_6]